MIKRLLVWMSLLGMAFSFADAAVFDIDSSGRYRPSGMGRPPSTALVLGGQQIEIRWPAEGAGPIPVTIARTTSARRIVVASLEATAEAGTASVHWNVPATNGLAMYEVAATEKVILIVGARGKTWFERGRKLLREATWSAVGLDGDEIFALRAIGLKVNGVRKSPTVNASVTMTLSAAAGGARRDVTLDGRGADRVVWTPGVAEGDWRVRAPRWWFSKEALATDEGRIRMVSLLIDSPEPP
ncbi:MAG: hypothetical protein H7A50_11695 [Akkermansiaceae bacterium]|nr:hypothetical protein [Akkermansiaceae bacterium]